MGTKSALLEIATRLAEVQHEQQEVRRVDLTPYAEDLRAMMEAGLSLRIIRESLAKIEGGFDIDIKTVRKHLIKMHPDLYARKYARSRGTNKKGVITENLPDSNDSHEIKEAPNKLEPKPNQVSPVGGTDPQELIRQAEALMGEPIREDLRDVLIKECEYQAGKGLSFDFEQIDDLCHLLKKKMTDARSLKSTLTFNYFKK